MGVLILTTGNKHATIKEFVKALSITRALKAREREMNTMTKILLFFKRFCLNMAGFVLGYGNCPNCGDSWFKNERGDIEFEPDHEGVMICSKCLGDPSKLSPTVIKSNLIRKMDNYDIEKVLLEVKKLKKCQT